VKTFSNFSEDVHILALLRDERVNAEVRDNVRGALWKLAQAEKIPIRFE